MSAKVAREKAPSSSKKSSRKSAGADVASPAAATTTSRSTRQATPFAKNSAKPTRDTRKQTLQALNEQEDGSEGEEEEDDDAAMSDVDSPAAAEEDVDPTGSLVAQFEAASHDGSEDEDNEDGDDDDEAADSNAGESGSDDDDDDGSVSSSDRGAKKRKTGSASSTVTKKSTEPKEPKVLQLTPTTQKELDFHLKQLHRIMKKLRAFQTKKVVRKLKETKALGAPAPVLAALESDLDLTKHFNLEHMSVLAWRIYNLHLTHKKLNWSDVDAPTLETIGALSSPDAAAAATPRLKELMSQCLYAPASKKAVTEYLSTYVKKQRKSRTREKKLESIVESAAKRKEKEKAAKKRAEEREKKQKEKAKESKKESDDENSSDSDEEEDAKEESATKPTVDDEEESRDAKRSEKLSRREQQKQKKAEVAAAAAAEEKKSSAKSDDSDASSESESESDSDSEDGPSKPAPLKSKPSRVFGGLSVGTIVSGVVSGVEKFGLFIEFVYKKKERKGLCHISMASDAYVADLGAQFAKGDALEAIVTKLDERSGRISLGLKSSLFPAGHTAKPVQHLSKTAVALASEEESTTKDPSKLESVFMDTLAEKKAAAPADAKLATIKRFMTEVSGSNAQKSDKKNRLGQRERRKLIGAVLGADAIKPVLEDKRAGWKRKIAEKEAERKSTEEKVSGGGGFSTTTASGSDPYADASLNRRERRLKMHRELAEKGDAPQAFMAQLAAGKFDRTTPKPKKESAPAPKPAAAAPTATAHAAAPRAYAPKPEPRPAAAKPAPAPVAVAAPALDETMHPSWLAKQAQAAKLAAAPKGKKITFD